MDLNLLQTFANELTAKFSLPGPASAEDQLKPTVSSLLGTAGTGFGLTIATRTETHLSEHKVRPDIAVYVGGLICGYVELKAPGLGADAPKLKGKHNKKQWERLKGLPNLLYTDGREWALYRSGERTDGQTLVRFHGDPTKAGTEAVTTADASALGRLLKDFLGWKPIVPHRPPELAKYLAPLTRFLRTEIEISLGTKGSAVELLATEWRQFFFPDADDARFADAYAQTVTYAMLLARLAGAAKLDPTAAAATLDKNNGLLARTLELLGQKGARDELRVGFELLQRSLEVLDPHEFLKSKPDLWLYFYEDFLAAYDPKLRRDYGVYYTPREVVELQVRFASELLEKRFGKKLGFADDGVIFLDPAVGTGTYPVAAVKHGLALVAKRSGEPAVPERARQMAENMLGFELLVGPYAVAHLRLTQALEGAMNGNRQPADPELTLGKRLKIFLADTLASPTSAPPGGFDLTHKALTDEHEAARRVKNEGDILVCLGNPPYDRERRAEDGTKANKGGWVRFGDRGQGKLDMATGEVVDQVKERPIFEDFLAPARKAGKGLNVQVIFNDYVYFWRWALWRLFEKQNGDAVVSFITASSYLTGSGFSGMREVMRRTFDELWVLDLGGDNLGARKTPNVFAIQTPVVIAMGYRSGAPDPQKPAKVHYAKIDAVSRSAKLDLLEQIGTLASVDWRDAESDWQAPLLPKGSGKYFDWPKLTDLFPYHTAGAVFYRSWPIGETKEVLGERWRKLVAAKPEERIALFKQSRDRKVSHKLRDPDLPGYATPSVRDAAPDAAEPGVIRYGFRALDRQFAYYDFRLGDYLRPSLWRMQGPKQMFLIAPDSLVPGLGPLVTCSADLPDQHFFRGSFGGKDVIPLYRDAKGTVPNVTAGLLGTLENSLGIAPDAEDLAAYAYALLSSPAFVEQYWNELETPGPRLPLTKDKDVFADAASLGRELIWLHTYAQRFRASERGDEVPKGGATTVKGVSSDPATYPEQFSYDEKARQIVVGDGRFGPVPSAVWAYEISGLKVVQSWLGYRMKKRAGRKSSPLDDIRPNRWTPRLSDELLELLWVLEATVAMRPKLKAVLDRAIASPCFTSAELPRPSTKERAKAGETEPAGDLFNDSDLIEEPAD